MPEEPFDAVSLFAASFTDDPEDASGFSPPSDATSEIPSGFSRSSDATSEVSSGISRSSDAASDVPSGFSSPRPIARKEYYSISEVCDLVDLRPHVLRYWETQFALLNPSKNRSGNRVYQRKEIRLILLVKHLLYEEKYTVEGAKKKLEQLRKGGELQSATKGALDKQMVALLRAEMQTLTELLTPPKTSP
jgi:DNA-binding transcriptional MerR regulator